MVPTSDDVWLTTTDLDDIKGPYHNWGVYGNSFGVNATVTTVFVDRDKLGQWQELLVSNL